MRFCWDWSRPVEQLGIPIQMTTVLLLLLEELWFLLRQDQQPLRYLPMFLHPTPLRELPRFLQEKAYPMTMIHSRKTVKLVDREGQAMQKGKDLQSSRDKQDPTYRDKGGCQMGY